MGTLSVLQPRHVFGLSGAARDSLCYADEESVAYIAGHSVVVYAPGSKAQRFIPANPESQALTALAVCPGAKLLALAERLADKPTITVFDLQTLKRRKVLTLPPEAGSKEFVSLAFSGDGKYLVAQAGAPDWTLALWVWEKSKLVATAKSVQQPGQTAVQCLFQPGEDAQLVSVVGEGLLRLFRIEAGNSLKAAAPAGLTKREGSTAYTCHAWLVDNEARETLVVGTADGEVLIVGEGELKQALQLEGGITCLAAFSKGFVAGSATGALSLIARETDAKPYRLERSFVIEGGSGNSSSSGGGGGAGAATSGASANTAADGASGSDTLSSADAVGAGGSGGDAAAGGAGGAIGSTERITALAASPADDGVAVATAGNQLLMLNIATGEKKGLYCTLGELAPPFHTAEVTGLATCVRRPLVATCSSDGSLRLWNYQDRSLELVKRFEAEPLSLALHPTGYMLLVGFADKLRLLSVLADDLRLVKELPIKGCRDVRFSNGGQYFAAVNSNTVHVYNAYTAVSLAVLRGHNGKVRSLWWSCDDSVLVTAGVDGAIYSWRVLDGKREREFVQKGWAYTCAVGMHGSPSAPTGAALTAGGPSSFIAATSDRRLRVLEPEAGSGGSGGLVVVQEVDVGSTLTHVIAPGAGAGRILFAADEEGGVRAYKLPLSAEHQAQRCGLGPAVARIAATHDESLLFAATRDGCVWVYDVRDRDPLRLANRKEGEGLPGLPFSEEVLAARGDIDDKRLRMAELEAQVAEFAAQNEYQLKLKDLALNEKVRELTEAAEAEAAAAKERYDALLIERNDLEAQYEERLNKAEEKYQAQLSALDGTYQQKIISEMERYQELGKERDALNRRWEEQTAALVAEHGRLVEQIKSEYELRLEEQEQRHTRMQEDMCLLGRECKELQRQTEEDADREVEELKEKWQKQVLAEKEACLRLKGENGLLRKKFDEQQKAIDDARAALRGAEGDKRQLHAVIDGLHRDIAGLQREVASRDDAIAEKEKRILDLKRKTQELEKFRFVLEFRTNELRSQLDPKDAELEECRERLQAVEGEKQALHRVQQGMELAVSEQRLREAGLRKEVQRQRLALAEARRHLRQVQCDIYAVAQHIQSPDQLKAAVASLYQSHAAEGAGPKAEGGAGDSGSSGEAAGAVDAGSGADMASRQAQLASKELEGVKVRAESDRKAAATNHRRLVAENAVLIAEINELRKEVKLLKEAKEKAAVAGTAKPRPAKVVQVTASTS